MKVTKKIGISGRKEMNDERTVILTFPKWEDLSWQDNASCRGMDTNLFYYDHLQRGQQRLAKANKAKAICQGCPVKLQCLTDAVKRDDRHSIQGGTSPEDRGSTGEGIPCWPLDKVMEVMKHAG